MILTCEHGGNRVPAGFAGLFRIDRQVLQTHRGYDQGALELARAMSRHFRAPLIASTTTRLLVDLNRSEGHRRLFSEYSAALDEAVRLRLLDRHYRPYRCQVEALVAEQFAQGRAVLHVSVHSFTPMLDGQIRQADVGLLYDPARLLERQLCHTWQAAIRRLRPDLRVRRNYPYLGTSDGLTTHLRRQFPADRYAGLELEINQRWPQEGNPGWRQLRRSLIESLQIAKFTSLASAPA
jgi:predicted N-formylglutamate amidohydrolase